LLAAAESALPIFEAFDDERSLGRTWLLIGYVQGGIHGNHAAWEEAEEKALAYYRRTAFPTATCLQQIAAAIYWGPTPVPQGIARCTELSVDGTIGISGRASILPFLGGLHAQLGDFGSARELIDEAEAALAELGAHAAVAIFCGAARADVELLAGDLGAAEVTLREQCEFLEHAGHRASLAVRASRLADVLFMTNRLEEARTWAALSRASAASDDQSVQLVLVPVEAKLLAAQGNPSKARRMLEDLIRPARTNDGLNLIASTRLALAEVLRMDGLCEAAEASIHEAIVYFERKGNIAGATQARVRIAREVPV
jgi:tetratricopeptide (TPR) repeat protein